MYSSLAPVEKIQEAKNFWRISTVQLAPGVGSRVIPGSRAHIVKNEKSISLGTK
jgi:hypothetical protein